MKIPHPERFRFRMAPALLAALALLFASTGAGWAEEEEAAPKEEVSEELKKEASEAYDAMIDDANARFAKARAEEQKTTGIELELADEFVEFAEKYAGTDEAVIAWIQAGMLARMASDYDRAEKYLEKADELTDKPSYQADIQRELTTMKIRPGMPTPNFQVSTVEGDTLRPDDLRGQVFLLDFWATWCSPCLAELPNVKKVYKQYHPQGFEIVSVSLDEDREYFEEFIEKQEMDWIHVYNPEQSDDQDLAERYGVVAIPRMILIDEEGTIIEASLRGHQLNEALAKVFEEEE